MRGQCLPLHDFQSSDPWDVHLLYFECAADLGPWLSGTQALTSWQGPYKPRRPQELTPVSAATEEALLWKNYCSRPLHFRVYRKTPPWGKATWPKLLTERELVQGYWASFDRRYTPRLRELDRDGRCSWPDSGRWRASWGKAWLAYACPTPGHLCRHWDLILIHGYCRNQPW